MWFGLGYAPAAPGTAGAAGAVALFVAFFGALTGAPWFPGTRTPVNATEFALWFGAVGLGLTAVGTWAATRVEARFGRHDDGRIVVDEVAGQWIALSPLPWVLGFSPSFLELSVGVVTAFVLFRLFDVWKPGAVGWAERRFERGWGVMADDLVAGIFAAFSWVAAAVTWGAAAPTWGAAALTWGTAALTWTAAEPAFQWLVSGEQA